MVPFLITILSIGLLVGTVYLLLQEPRLLAAGGSVAVGVVLATMPLIISMAPVFGALVFGAGAVAITYGVMAINAHRQSLEFQREMQDMREFQSGPAARPAFASRTGRQAAPADDGEGPVSSPTRHRAEEPVSANAHDDAAAEEEPEPTGYLALFRLTKRLGEANAARATAKASARPGAGGSGGGSRPGGRPMGGQGSGRPSGGGFGGGSGKKTCPMAEENGPLNDALADEELARPEPEFAPRPKPGAGTGPSRPKPAISKQSYGRPKARGDSADALADIDDESPARAADKLARDIDRMLDDEDRGLGGGGIAQAARRSAGSHAAPVGSLSRLVRKR